MKYIALYYATGPTKITIPHHWRMICQNNVNKIVMLTNLEESGKVINLYFLFQFLDFCFTAVFSFRVLKVKFLSIMLMIIACLVLNISTSINV